MTRSFSVCTLGCRANQADSERLSAILRGAGLQEVEWGAAADLQIVNSCTVTREADRKSAQMVRRATSRDGLTVVTGCGVAARGGLSARLPGSVLRLPPGSAGEEILALIGAESCPNTLEREREWTLRRQRTRALLRIQDGCNQFCTFCIVPYVRGRARSQTVEWVLAECRRLEAEGYGEVVLSGIHLSAWGSDLEPRLTLTELLQALLAGTEGLRFRLSSVEPDQFPAELIDLMALHPRRLCPHLHLVLQHASDRVLERMHRGYTLSHYQDLTSRFLQRVEGASLTTDVLVGFPGEDESDFRQLQQFLRATPFSRIHVFPYSARPGTAAARFPGAVPPEVLAQRRDSLLSIARRQRDAFQRASLGQVREALMEGSRSEGSGWLKGTTDNFLPVWLRGGLALRGQRLPVRLLRRWKEGIVAETLGSGAGGEDHTGATGS